MSKEFPAQAAKLILQKITHQPKLGLVLGSGLGAIAAAIEQAQTFAYTDLPGFPHMQVDGHGGQLVVGTLAGLPVACLQGRSHRYETGNTDYLKCMIRTLKLIGCQQLLLTNASGSLREDVAPGELMLITDHINFSFSSPLIGANDAEFGERFTAMENAYDADLRAELQTIAQQQHIALAEGVYIGVCGPTFETPAEIRAFRVLGADAVGMSTVPDVILARHCGLRLAVIAAITNFAAGMSSMALSHEQTLSQGALASAKLQKLILAYCEKQYGNHEH